MTRMGILTLLGLVGVLPLAHGAVRLKDITDVEGARPNQLYGFGLVVGLEKTGGKSLFTQQVAADMLQKLCVNVKIAQQVQTDNVIRSQSVSAVMVTAEIGPFARCGSRLDVTVAVMDDCSSLQGGVLLLTPLTGVDGEIYAVAQGPLSVGGFMASGQGASVQKNFVTTARIAGGALVEKEARGEILCDGHIRLLLKNPDYATARAISVAVNQIRVGHAVPLDAGTVQVDLFLPARSQLVSVMSDLGNLLVIPDSPARVVINERTGTIVAGENVKIATIAIAHGNLAIVTRETPVVSQPAPFSNGKTKVVPRTQVGITEQGGALMVAPRSVTVADLANALNALGVTPRDLVCIFQAIKQAGALQAELVLI